MFARKISGADIRLIVIAAVGNAVAAGSVLAQSANPPDQATAEKSLPAVVVETPAQPKPVQKKTAKKPKQSAPKPVVSSASPDDESPSNGTSTDLATAPRNDDITSATKAFQDTPAGVSVITGKTAQEQGMSTVRDLAQSVPNVTAFDAGGNRMSNFTIRGNHELGYQSSPGVVPNVAYYVDDVPALTSLARTSLFSRVDQIDLLKGPQGTTFGFSRPAGVIDIHTANPTAYPSGYVTGAYGNHNAYEAGAGFSTPLVARGAYLTADFLSMGRDGFYDNTGGSDPYGEKSAYSGRGKLTIVPTSRTTIDFIVQHERFDDESDPFIPLGALATNPFDVTLNDPGHEKIGQDLQAIRVKSRFDDFDMLSVTSHRRSTWDFLNDGDLTASPSDPFNPFARLLGYTTEKVDSTTQELRFNSRPSQSPWQWSGGLFAAHTTMDFDAGTLAYPGVELPPYLTLRHSKTTSYDIAVFGDVKYQLGSGFAINPGLRYEWAGREGSNEHAAPYITSASEDFSAVLPSIALLYHPVSDFTAFARYVRGFKPGGFIADRALTDYDEFRFKSEFSDNYEVGFKSVWMGGTMFVNGSLFYTNTNDYQVVNKFSPSDFGVNNAQRVESYGGELEASVQMTPAWRLFAGVGVTKAEFISFRNTYGDFSGNEVSFVPTVTTNYGVEYRSSWGGYMNVRARTLGSYYLDEGNSSKQDAGTTLVDAVIGYTFGNFDVSLFGRNIFDERYIINVYDFAGTGTAAYGLDGDPATYGVRTRITF